LLLYMNGRTDMHGCGRNTYYPMSVVYV
jgi:hypothetical protein